MTFQEYCLYFQSLLEQTETPQPPYDQPDYMDYTRLNWARMNRWLKTGILLEELKAAIKNTDGPRQWIILTEPWCGDAAHCIPFLHLASLENHLISVSYELRDSEPFRINDYLTHQAKSIPKLIIRDGEGKDLAVWGPRPAECQVLYERLKSADADFETIKTEIQLWYNNNKGTDLQKELTALLHGSSPQFQAGLK